MSLPFCRQHSIHYKTDSKDHRCKIPHYHQVPYAAPSSGKGIELLIPGFVIILGERYLNLAARFIDMRIEDGIASFLKVSKGLFQIYLKSSGL